MRLLTVFLTFLLILTACAAPAEPTATSPEKVSEPESDRIVLNGTFETSLLVTEWKGKSEGNMLFPLDPTSGAALPGYKPIPLGHSSFHVFSPDQRTLAMVSYPNEGGYRGNLLLIDLSEWQTQTYELELWGWVNTMVFSRDGSRLAIAHGESNHNLTIVNLEKGTITAQSQTDSYVPYLKFTENGEALMLYSPTINTTNGLSAGPPQVLLIDAEDLSPRWSAELDGVHDGIFPEDENVTSADLHEPGQALYISPGVTFAPDRDTLYVVHADAEQLTTVDFGAQKVKTVDIQAQLSWFEQLLSLTAGVASAKIADGTNKHAAISSDGRFLYVVGMHNASFQDKSGNWQTEQTPLGLEILRTSDGSRVEHFETDATDLSLSPDGRFLYLRNWSESTPWTEVFDTSTQQVIAHKEEAFAMPAFLMNGEFLLVSIYSNSETSHHMSVLEADDLSPLAAWTVNGDTYFYWLIPLGW